MKSSWAILLGLGLLLTGCVSPTTSSEESDSSDLTLGNAAQVSAVTAVSPADLEDSGATTFPTSLEDLTALVLEVATNPSASDQYEIEAAKASALGGEAYAILMTAGSDLMESVDSTFLTEKKLTKSINLSAGDAGGLFSLTKASANASLKAQTFDGSAIANDSGNLKAISTSAQATVDVTVDTSFTVVAQGFLRDALIRVNFGTDALATASQAGDFTSTGTGSLALNFSYGVKASWGLSFNKNGKGGKIILTAESAFKNSQTVDAPVDSIQAGLSLGEDFFSSNQAVTVTAQIYNDDNVLQNTIAYESTIAELFSSAVGLAGL